MRRFAQHILLAFACLGASAAHALSEREPCAKPFDDAAIVPADVSLYLQIEDAAKLREQLAGWPIGDWVTQMLRGEDVALVWSGLCTRMNASESTLFDTLFGSRCTVVTRSDSGPPADAGDEPAATQWAVILHINEPDATQLLRKLRSVHPVPIAGVIVTRVPEQRVLLARAEDRVIAGSSDEPELFYDIVRRIGNGSGVVGPALAATPTFEQTRALGNGQVSVYTRNPASAGGHSFVTAKLHRGRVYLRQCGEFDRSPFSRPVTQIEIDASPIRAVEDGALAAFIEPTDIGDTMLERFLGASFGTGLLSPEMRKDIGDRRLVVIGEEEGRLRENPNDILAPTLAIVYERSDDAGDPAALVAVMDSHVPAMAAGLSRRMNALTSGPQLDVSWNAGDPRQIDLSPAAATFTGDLPIFNSLMLSWGVAVSEAGQWSLLATHPTLASDLSRALADDDDCGRSRLIDNAGALNGVRLARHLRSWGDRADEVARPGMEQQFRDSVTMISGLLDATNRVRWRMRRPTRTSMQLDVEIELVPPQSTER